MLIKFENGKMKVQTEYNSGFVRKAKELQGKWKSPYWEFPEENEDFVRDALLKFYGEDGRVHGTVTLDINLDEYDFFDVIKLDSVMIAERPGRDRAVNLHKNAMVVSGGFCNSGGSMNNPRVTCDPGTVLRVSNFPISLYENIKNVKGITLTPEAKHSKVSLLHEKEVILSRLAEIDSLLSRL